MLKSPSPSRASLVRHSLYKLNRTGDKQHPCLTRLPICTLLVSPRSSRTLTFCSMYNLLTNLRSRQSMPIHFRICINLVQFTQSNAFCQSMNQTHSSIQYICIYMCLCVCGPGSSVDIATDYRLDGPGSNSGGDEIFRPSRTALAPPSLL